MPITRNQVNRPLAPSPADREFNGRPWPFTAFKKGQRFAFETPPVCTANGQAEPNHRQAQWRRENLVQQIQVRYGNLTNRSRRQIKIVGQPFGIEPSKAAIRVERQDIGV